MTLLLKPCFVRDMEDLCSCCSYGLSLHGTVTYPGSYRGVPVQPPFKGGTWAWRGREVFLQPHRARQLWAPGGQVDAQQGQEEGGDYARDNEHDLDGQRGVLPVGAQGEVDPVDRQEDLILQGGLWTQRHVGHLLHAGFQLDVGPGAERERT